MDEKARPGRRRRSFELSLQRRGIPRRGVLLIFSILKGVGYTLLGATLGLAVVGYLIFLISGRIRKRCVRNSMANIGGLMTVVFSFTFLLMLIAMAIEHIGVDAEYAKKKQHQEFLVAQYKTGVYNGSALSQYHLLQQIDEWNCNLAEKQKLTHDYWVGIFVPNYYDDLEYITVNLFEDVTTGRE